MTDVVLERQLDHPIAKVFTFLTDPDLVMQWWGPDYVVARRGQVDFTKPGPWELIMDIEEGRTVHVSGEITEVDPPNSIAYTWAWHRPDGRGHESNVRVALKSHGSGTMLTLTHSNLPEEDQQGHKEGWTSTLNNLQKFAATN